MMVKDPEDNGRTAEIPFPPSPLPEYYADVTGASNPENVGEFKIAETPVEPVEEAEPEFKSTLSPEAKAQAEKALRARSFSERNRTLGKMINCQVCGTRHRANQKPNGQAGKCEQKFTYTVKDADGRLVEVFREDPDLGTLVPYLRTAVDPELQPTPRQIEGAPFKKNSSPRYNPHLSAWNLELVERTRKVFAEMGFTITESENPEIQKQAHKNMEIARKTAIRQMINERRAKRVAKRNQTKLSRRINWGLA